MKILVSGGRGQLGRALARRGAAHGDQIAALARGELDICVRSGVNAILAGFQPDLAINAAAYTAVDKAESERELAFAINRDGAANMARACAARGIPVLHVSTDYVFDGRSTSPYREDDPVTPIGAYAESKAAGERAVQAAGGSVVRTSWLFEERGPSFVHTILRLAAERPVLRVVQDQVGCPTWADHLADALLALARLPARASTYHYCNDGAISWHGFASAIVEEARRRRSLRCERVEAITTADYPTPAPRPSYSVLDTSRIRSVGITPPPWRHAMAHVIAQVFSE